MQASNELKEQGRTIWLAIRFLIFGLAGFCFTTECSLGFLSIIYDDPASESAGLIFLALFIGIGTLMMLYGFGAWGRWDCYWVFLGLHLSSLYAVWAYNRPESDGGKMLGLAIILAVGTAITWVKARSF